MDEGRCAPDHPRLRHCEPREDDREDHEHDDASGVDPQVLLASEDQPSGDHECAASVHGRGRVPGGQDEHEREQRVMPEREVVLVQAVEISL